MGKVSTNELLDNFFESPEGSKYAKNRKIIKEDQLYEYEMQIGKELIDMDVEELIDFLSNIKIRKNKVVSNVIMNSHSLDQILVIYRKIFDYYIEEYEVIKNPFRNPKMRGAQLYNRLYENKRRFDWEMVDDIIHKLHQGDNQLRADYIELIILLYYNGFENASEIVNLQERDINHNAKTVLLPGRMIHLSDRCYGLLTKFNSMTELTGWRNFALVSWHNSYFKFIVRESKVNEIDDKPLKAMRESINVYLCKYVNNEYNTQINYSNLYLLGFYDFLTNKFGEGKVNKMLSSNYDSDAVQQLQQAAREYGFRFENVSHLKRRMRMFVKPEELIESEE